jgi:hypothetical protein
VGTGAWFIFSKLRSEIVLDIFQRLLVVGNVVWVVLFVFAVEKILLAENADVLFNWHHFAFGVEVVNVIIRTHPVADRRAFFLCHLEFFPMGVREWC